MLLGPETSVMQGLKHCNKCGSCCRSNPCLLRPPDVKRISERLGVSAMEFMTIERTPLGQLQVRMKGRPCVALRGNECGIHDVKPTGGREFECWEPKTFGRTYFWTLAEIESAGFRIQGAA